MSALLHLVGLRRLPAILSCAVGAAFLGGALACAPVKVGPTAPRPARDLQVRLPAGPALGVGELSMPSLDLTWEPPVLLAGDRAPLAAAIQRHPEIVLVHGAALAGDHDVDAIRGWIAAHAPATRVARAAELDLAPLLAKPPTSAESVAGDERATLELAPEGFSRLRELGSTSVLLFDRAPIETDRWRARAARHTGSCDPLLAAIGTGQEQSLALLEPFMDHADEVLQSLHVERLAATIPAARHDLAEFATPRPRDEFREERQFRRHSCGRRVLEVVDAYGTCLDHPSACAWSPRLYVQGGARIGAVEPSVHVPDECPELLGKDYLAALREPARMATADATDYLDVEWSMLVDRFSTLGELYAALEDVCSPRRRRFSSADLEGGRRRIEHFADTYRRPESLRHDTRWLFNEESFHVPGLGAIHQFARFDSGTGSAARDLTRTARGLREFLLGRAHCQREGEELPLVAAVVDVEAGEVEFVDYYYEEEFLCGDDPRVGDPTSVPP